MSQTQVQPEFIAGALVPIGGIIMWSGSVATIPSSWALCNGTNGTPNLQDRFLVGAGSGYAVGATGGSANATLVSHSHTATSSVNDPGHNHTWGVDDNTGASGNGNPDANPGSNNRPTSFNGTGITIQGANGPTGDGSNYGLAGQGHSHSFSGSGSGSLSGASFSGSALDFAVQYIDIILCTKN